ncbi:hypothetical protein [Pedobacter riviphilus]|uniref:hypothetical protein n=1 Tax=Pedobacter riviphilus TaxID=2766984 RepID=UPI001CC26353|nr:hypothetical protein [Pedobacter riviphilus]
MKIKSIYKISFLYLFLVAIGITGCKKDILNVEPTDILSPATIETDTTALEAYITNRYLGTRLQDKEADGSAQVLVEVLNIACGALLQMNLFIIMMMQPG